VESVPYVVFIVGLRRGGKLRGCPGDNILELRHVLKIMGINVWQRI